MQISLKKARTLGTMEGSSIRLGTSYPRCRRSITPLATVWSPPPTSTR